MTKGKINKGPEIIVLTGPESTGKTTLARQLAGHYRGQWIPEYARTFVENLKAPYTYEDVIHIARHQIEVPEQMINSEMPVVFLDTDLIIIKVWLSVVYGKVPEWLHEAIANRKIDLYLLCRPDIVWVADPVRENPGRKREELFLMYEEEIKKYNFRYGVVTGKGDKRLFNAVTLVDKILRNRREEEK